LLKPAFDQLAAGAEPPLLWHVLQMVQYLPGPLNMAGLLDPDFWQALVRRQFARYAA
jgi:hypothetical protein